MPFGEPKLNQQPPQPEQADSATLYNVPLAERIEKEIASVEIRAVDKDQEGRLLAYPGGPTSHLPERFWKIARTPAFREWFGDWENIPVESFTTSHGSVYTYESDGRVRRHKTATGEDFPPQELTAFVHVSDGENDAWVQAGKDELRLYETRPADGKSRRVVDAKAVEYPENLEFMWVKNEKAAKRTRATLKPTRGYSTFEILHVKEREQTFIRSHFGHEVVDMRYADSDVSKMLNENGEPALLPTSDGTLSFVKMAHPLEIKGTEVEDWAKLSGLSGDPRRFEKYIVFIRGKGYDGLVKDGLPVSDKQTGLASLKPSQILSFEKDLA